MSQTNLINNDETLFQFDPFDARQSFVSSSPPQHLSSETTAAAAVLRIQPQAMSSHDGSPTSWELDVGNDDSGPSSSPVVAAGAKGKARTIPVPIRASTIVHDLFDMSLPTSQASPTSYRAYESSSSSTAFSAASPTDFDHHHSIYRHRSFSVDSMEQLDHLDSLEDADASSSSYIGKGKQKESFPLLPPLTFSVMELDYGGGGDPSTPGPSSYGTFYSPPSTNQSLPAPSAFSSARDISIPSPTLSPSPESGSPIIPRRRSLCNLSQPLSPSLASVSTAITQAHATFGPVRAPSNISRQLILDKKEHHTSSDDVGSSTTASTEAIDPTSMISKVDLLTIEREPGSCPPAWYTVSKPLSPANRMPAPRALLKGKSRSQSSPYPISALDIIPVTSTDIFQPVPIVIQNYFDLFLPKELRLHILRALVDLHEQDYTRAVYDGRMTMAKAASSRSRWVGRDKGIRELFKLSRVSKSWQSLVLDGELWTNLELRSFPGIPPDTVVRLVQSAGTFIRNVDLAGHVHLHPESMTSITNDLCLSLPGSSLAYTQLTTINLQGCVSLTTRSLHHLLVRSRFLQVLSVKGLAAVTNTTCDIIANFCQHLTSLNMSRCGNMDAEGIRSLAVAANLRGERLKLRQLRLSGLKHVSDSMMRALGRAAPYLEVLDLSYSRHLHNSALEAFVACDEHGSDQHHLQQLGVDTILVSARDLGRDSNDSGPTKFRRRITHLRHLVLSFCVMLTDTACSNLAYSVPKLEFLEMAGIGPDLKDGGLVRLFGETLFIRRVDLEDASDIGNAVVVALTPAPGVDAAAVDGTPAAAPAETTKQTGHLLEQLNISYAANVTDDALLKLVRNCPKLTVLEADNTRMGSTVLREFIKLARERQALDARIVAIDCRGIGESLVKELAPMTRPRMGWRKYEARRLGYLDGRDESPEDDASDGGLLFGLGGSSSEGSLMKVAGGQDECDETRVVIKTFYSWQTVDAVKSAREKRRRTTGRRAGSEDSTFEASGRGGVAGGGDGVVGTAGGAGRSTRWWSPGGRRAYGRTGRTPGTPGRTSPPILPDLNGDGCTVM